MSRRFAAAIVSDRALVAELGANARRAAEDFGWPRIAEKEEREYRACLAP